MWAVNGLLAAVALVMLAALITHSDLRRDSSMLPLRALATPTLALAAIDLAVNRVWRPGLGAGDLNALLLCLGCGLGVLLISYAASREFRLAVQR